MGFLNVLGGIGGFAVGGIPGAIIGSGNGGRAWRALTGQTEAPENGYDYDPDGLAMREYDRLTNPNYGLDQFQRLAGSASLGAGALVRLAKARGGSVAQGAEMAKAQTAQVSDQAFSGFRQFRTDADQRSLGVLAMDAERRRFMQEMEAGRTAQNAVNRTSFINNIIGTAGYALGAGGGG